MMLENLIFIWPIVNLDNIVESWCKLICERIGAALIDIFKRLGEIVEINAFISTAVSETSKNDKVWRSLICW